MVRSGIVVRVDVKDQTGIIEDKNGREFFFCVQECFEGKLPEMHAVVTFVKDPDFKTTDVASLVKPSEGWQKIKSRPFFPAA
jgi:hypothetical protein